MFIYCKPFFLYRPNKYLRVSVRITYKTSNILKMANAVLEIQQTCIKIKPKIIDPYLLKLKYNI